VPRALRSFVWPLLFLVLAAVMYRTRISNEMADFAVYRTAAQRALAGEPLYRAEDGHYRFKYLPAFALAMAPFALVDVQAARLIWFALSAGLLTAFVRWSVRALPERRRSERVLLWLTVVFMAKFYAHELTLGQTNILLGVLLVGALLAVQIGEPAVAGLLIAAGAFVKPYALLLLPWLGFTYGAAPALLAAGLLLAGLFAPAVVYGWSGNLDQLTGWLGTVTGSTEGNLLGADNISLAAMWAKWIGIGRTAAVLATATTGAVLGLVAMAWVRRETSSEPDYLEVALLLLLIPLLSPQGWDYVLLLGTPAVVCLLDRWHDVSPPWRLLIALSLILMGLTIFDLMGRALYGHFMQLSIVSVAALAAAVALTHLRWKALG
jgi:hypothetical protein